MTSTLSPLRRLIEATGLLFCGLLVFRAVCVEPYCVPSGSMAPALSGHHKAIACPDCGFRVVVGQREPAAERGSEFCPNCGSFELNLDPVSVSVGDQLLVNKNVFDWRTPRRWEMAVFRCPADPTRAFVKRVVGLPGETVQIRGGDVYIDHEIARKTLSELRAVRIPVYDSRHIPRSRGLQDRWETEADLHTAGVKDDGLFLHTVSRPDTYQWLGYRHQSSGKSRAVCDEYGYNGADLGPLPEPVHDFLVECELEASAGEGWVALAVTDGADEMVVELPVSTVKDGAKLSEGRRPDHVYRSAPEFVLQPGRHYRVEVAFVDRRAMLAVDGVPLIRPSDRPAVEHRSEVAKPFRIGARGVEVRVHRVQLWRDIHYTEAGRHGSRSEVRLGAREYFVLGDNSPNSDDNRFWTGRDGEPMPVKEREFLGKPFAVHLPSRTNGDSQRFDWERVRWLR